jgi:hypothetical protein
MVKGCLTGVGEGMEFSQRFTKNQDEPKITQALTRANGKEPERQTVPENEHAKTSQTVEEPVQTSTSPRCPFTSEVVAIDLKRFADSGIALVECPLCSRTRSLSPVKGILRFPYHTKRKTNAPVTGERWATSDKTDWGVVGGK